MKSIRFAMFAFLTLSIALTSCVSKKKFQELQSEKEQLSESLSEAEDQINTLQEEKEDAEMAKEKAEQHVDELSTELESTEMAKERAQEKAEKKEKQVNMIMNDVRKTFMEVENSGMTVEEKNNKFYVSLGQKVQYRSGSKRLSSADLEVIDSVASLLKRNPDLHLIVEGHTDYVPIAEDVVVYADNWDLSVARSIHVVRTLIRKGVNPKQLTAAGKSKYQPEVTGDDGEKAVADPKNRRTEFILLPNMDGVMKVYKEQDN